MTPTRLLRQLLILGVVPTGILLCAHPSVTQEPTAEASKAVVESPRTEPGKLLEESRGVRREGNVEGVASQKRVEELSDATEKIFSRYSNALRQTDSIRVYNKQMDDLVASQREELDSITAQLDRVDEVGRSVTPLMLRMIDSLEAFVRLDIPFLKDERAQRIANLREMMARADVTNAEKFRSILEAYQIENEFGRTIEAYRARFPRDDKELTVDFLRFGRIALVYQTIDESEAGVWDQKAREWRTLDSSYRTAIRQGLRIARKQAAPDMIRVPLPAAETVGGSS